MKEYPSIPTLPTQGSSSFAHWKRNHNMSEIYAFDKIDGSNVKVGWSSKEGFCELLHPLGWSSSQ